MIPPQDQPPGQPPGGVKADAHDQVGDELRMEQRGPGHILDIFIQPRAGLRIKVQASVETSNRIAGAPFIGKRQPRRVASTNSG